MPPATPEDLRLLRGIAEAWRRGLQPTRSTLEPEEAEALEHAIEALTEPEPFRIRGHTYWTCRGPLYLRG